MSAAPVAGPFHDLKSWPDHFSEVWKGDKTHEVRRADRDYKVGDVVRLREFLPGRAVYTGRWVRGIITAITLPGPVGDNVRLPEGIVVFSFAEHARGGDDL